MLDSVTEVKFAEVLLGAMGGLWSVANPRWEPSLRFLQAALALENILQALGKIAPSPGRQSFL